MTPARVVALLAFVAAVCSDVGIRLLANPHESLRTAFTLGTVDGWLAALPLLLVSLACYRAAQSYGARASLLVFPIAMAPLAYLTFDAERAQAAAFAAHKWTAGALEGAFRWFFSLVLVGLITLGVFFVCNRHDRHFGAQEP